MSRTLVEYRRFSPSRVDGIFAAARGAYRIQHSGDKPSHQKRLIAGAPKNHVHVYPVLHPALYSSLVSTRRARSRTYRAISENMSRRQIGQQSPFLIVFKMAALLVRMHETVKDYIDSSENQPLFTEIRSELLQLSRAVIKKHTVHGERVYKFHLAQPARMLSRSFAYWHKTILTKMKGKTLASRPWTVFSPGTYLWRYLIASKL